MFGLSPRFRRQAPIGNCFGGVGTQTINVHIINPVSIPKSNNKPTENMKISLLRNNLEVYKRWVVLKVTQAITLLAENNPTYSNASKYLAVSCGRCIPNILIRVFDIYNMTGIFFSLKLIKNLKITKVALVSGLR